MRCLDENWPYLQVIANFIFQNVHALGLSLVKPGTLENTDTFAMQKRRSGYRSDLHHIPVAGQFVHVSSLSDSASSFDPVALISAHPLWVLQVASISACFEVLEKFHDSHRVLTLSLWFLLTRCDFCKLASISAYFKVLEWFRIDFWSCSCDFCNSRRNLHHISTGEGRIG